MVLRNRWIRLCLRSLILFCFLSRCTSSSQNAPVISIDWRDSVPIALTIPRQLLSVVDEDSVSIWLKIHLMNDSSAEPVMGEYIVEENEVIFQPLIPFTPSLHYKVLYREKSLAEIAIPSPHPSTAPEVVEIYPTQDTLPENLLKIYIRFSKPMRESDPLAFVYLLRQANDTVNDAFLDLRPALWDRNGKMLTLWLDPGRIKRELQPNQRLGPPLEEGESYKVIVAKGWPARDGGLLQSSSSKPFVAEGRDARSPEPSRWKIVVPARGTSDPLKVKFGEALDFLLLSEGIDIFGINEKILEGKMVVSGEETAIDFTPSSAWQRGRYKLRIESRLEDLAGNNLNRLFDTDISVATKRREEQYYTLEFVIE